MNWGDMMSIGDRIKELRISKNLTRKQVAEKAQLNEMAIYFYETGKRIPSTTSIGKVAIALNVDVAYLLGLERIERETIPFYSIERIDVSEGVEDTIVRLFGADFATTVPDNAMFPELKQGDTVFIKQSSYQKESGKVVLVDVKGEKLVRRLKVQSKSEIFLVAFNPEFETVSLELLDLELGRARFIGVIVGKATKVD